MKLSKEEWIERYENSIAWCKAYGIDAIVAVGTFGCIMLAFFAWWT